MSTAAGTPFGWRYQTAQQLAPGATISPLSAPEVGVAVGDLLPPA